MHPLSYASWRTLGGTQSRPGGPSVPILMLAGLVLTGCVVEGEGEPQTPSTSLRVLNLGYPAHYIRYDRGNGWIESPGILLEWEGSWRRFSSAGEPRGATFILGDGLGSWYPSPSGSVFRFSRRNVWLVNGLLFTHDPLLALAPADTLTLMTLNLHTYQESDADEKLDRVVEVIAQLQPDLITFQECAQSRDAPILFEQRGVSIRSDNMAYLITSRLVERFGLPYDYVWDWSHYGFSEYEEGLAVLVARRHLMLNTGSAWVSNSQSINDPLNARKVVYARVVTEAFGVLGLVSAHLSWGDEQNAQIDRTRAVLESLLEPGDRTGFIAGDLNAKAGEDGYLHMLEGQRYQDSYVEANSGLSDSGFLDSTTSDGSRIDYIFQWLPGAPLEPITAQRVFFDLEGAGQGQPAMMRVSDHRGVVVRFELGAN